MQLMTVRTDHIRCEKLTYKITYAICISALRLALVQLTVGDDKPANVSRAASFIERAKQERADIVALPECFNSPYGTCNYPM